MSQLALVRGHPVSDLTLKIPEVLLRNLHRLGLILNQYIDNPVRYLKRHRTHLFGRVNAQTAAFDHRRPAHGDCRIFCRNYDVTASEQSRITSKTSPMINPHQRHSTRQLRKRGKGIGIESNGRTCTVIPGTASTTLTKQNQRHAPTQSEFEHAVLLVVISRPLSAG